MIHVLSYGIFYAISIIILIYLLIVVKYKLSYPFWNKLHGFHTYQWWYWLKGEQLLDLNPLPRETKYYKKEYKTLCLNDIVIDNNDTVSNTIDFINKYFMNYDDAIYSIQHKQLENIQTKNTYITLCENEKNSILEGNLGQTMGGCIVSIPILLWSSQLKTSSFRHKSSMGTKYNNESKKEFIRVNYVDFLCVHPTLRKKDKASTLIYTHLTNTTWVENKTANVMPIPLYLFKNEGFKTKALVPVLSYNAYVIDLEKITLQNCSANLAILGRNSFKCVYLDPSNKKLLNDCLDFIYDITIMEKCNIAFLSIFTKDVLIKHILSNDIIVFCLMRHNTLHGMYFFKNIHSLIEKKKYEFSCLSSINIISSRETNKEFVYGFKIACVLCKTRLNNLLCAQDAEKYSYDLCCVEEMSHNYTIIRSTGIDRREKHSYKLPISYYSYNGLIHPKHPKNSFILT